jgi:hypothetical protein
VLEEIDEAAEEEEDDQAPEPDGEELPGHVAIKDAHLFTYRYQISAPTSV